MFTKAALGLALVALRAGASPLPQATITAVVAPPGLPDASYVEIGTGTAGDATLVAERVATLSDGSVTTVFDAIDAMPSQIIIVEAGGDGSILQAVACDVLDNNGTEICVGAVANNGTIEGYYYSGAGQTTIVDAAGISAVPTDILSIIQPVASNAYAFSSAIVSLAHPTVTALPGFVGQSMMMGNSTANATMSGSMMSSSMMSSMSASMTDSSSSAMETGSMDTASATMSSAASMSS